MKPTKLELTEMYVDKKMSIPQISGNLGICKTTVLNYMQKYDIPRRTIAESLSGKPKSLEHRHKLSESKKGNKHPNFGKKCPIHGKRCWYTLPNGRVVSMRSQWEVWYAEYLKNKNIVYDYEPTTFTLPDNSAYTPDFYLTTTDEFVEVKGWLTPKHKERLAMFQTACPDKKLIIADKKYLEGLGIDLRKKWIASKPSFPCDKCGEFYHRSYPKQRFCSTICRNQGKTKLSLQCEEKPKRKYNGIQSGGCNNSAKLTIDIVQEIRRLRANGYKLKEIAAKTGATIGNIYNILSGKSWKESM